MKKYPFPPGVTHMSEPDYVDHCTRCATVERDARAVRLAERAAKARTAAERKARRAALRASSPTGAVEALAVGESATFPEMRRTTQVSYALRAVHISTGRAFTSAALRSMMDGETVIGVRVTRVS